MPTDTERGVPPFFTLRARGIPMVRRIRLMKGKGKFDVHVHKVFCIVVTFLSHRFRVLLELPVAHLLRFSRSPHERLRRLPNVQGIDIELRKAILAVFLQFLRDSVLDPPAVPFPDSLAALNPLYHTKSTVKEIEAWVSHGFLFGIELPDPVNRVSPRYQISSFP